MRIVQLLPELNEGGVERGTVELSRELVRRGHDSVVISAGGKLASRIEEDGGTHLSLDVCSKNPFTFPLRMLKLRDMLKGIAPDILHARSRIPAWLAFLANSRLHIPFVTTVHGFNSVSPYSRVMTLGDRVICVSTAIEEYIQRHYGVPDEKCVVIPRGVDLDLFDPAGVDRTFMEEFSRLHGLHGRIVVSSVGRITQLKDYETFIRAIDLLRRELPGAVGLIVGGVRADKEKYFESLKRLVDSLGLSDHVKFVGSQAKVAEIYALSNVVVSSSKKPESFGRAAAEAIAMGVPVAATAHGGVLDIVKEEVTGALFPPGDVIALADAIRHCHHMKRDELRKFIEERFTLNGMVESTIRVYQCLAG